MKRLTAQDMLHIHDRLVESTGGSLGLREPGLLAAIADKPYATFEGKDLYPELQDKAAALYEALCNYYVFVDGNKRTALTCLEYFLNLQGFRLDASARDRESFTVKVATSHLDLAEVASWIFDHCAQV